MSKAEPYTIEAWPYVDTRGTLIADLLQAGFSGGFLEWNEITELSTHASEPLTKVLPKELLTYPTYVAHCFYRYDYAVRGKHKLTNAEFHFGYERLRAAVQRLISERFDEYVVLRQHGIFTQALADWFVQVVVYWYAQYDPKTGALLEEQSP